MNTLKNKKIWQILAIILIIVTTTILLFLPDVIDYKYPYYYENTVEKKEEIESLNGTLIQNEAEITNLIDELDTKEIDVELSTEEVEAIRAGIDPSHFNAHLPSVLIYLEQNAIDNKVDIEISYNQIKHSDSQGGVSGRPDDRYSDDEMEGYEQELIEMDENDDGVISVDEAENAGYSTPIEEGHWLYAYIEEDGKEDPLVTVEENQEENDEDNESDEDDEDNTEKEVVAVEGTIPNIEGIDVITIPIRITGTYYNSRNYIKTLDEVGMIEPLSMTISAQEDNKITTAIILNIFHGEVN